MGQDVDNPLNVMIDGTPSEVMNSFTYLGATITSNLSLDEEITTGIGKASVTMSRLSKWVWQNGKFTLATKICIYRVCILSILLYIVKHGQLMPIMMKDWTAFTFVA